MVSPPWRKGLGEFFWYAENRISETEDSIGLHEIYICRRMSAAVPERTKPRRDGAVRISEGRHRIQDKAIAAGSRLDLFQEYLWIKFDQSRFRTVKAAGSFDFKFSRDWDSSLHGILLCSCEDYDFINVGRTHVYVHRFRYRSIFYDFTKFNLLLDMFFWFVSKIYNSKMVSIKSFKFLWFVDNVLEYIYLNFWIFKLSGFWNK